MVQNFKDMQMNENETNQQLLMKLMEVSPLEYHNHVMDNAYVWLDHQIGRDIFGKEVMLYSQFFWAWWTNQWNRRNRIFINRLQLNDVKHILQPNVVRALKEEYQRVHSVEALNIYPSRVVIEASYAVMVGKVIDNELKVKR